jgi:hypothetical protein
VSVVGASVGGRGRYGDAEKAGTGGEVGVGADQFEEVARKMRTCAAARASVHGRRGEGLCGCSQAQDDAADPRPALTSQKVKVEVRIVGRRAVVMPRCGSVLAYA